MCSIGLDGCVCTIDKIYTKPKSGETNFNNVLFSSVHLKYILECKSIRDTIEIV